MEKLTQNDKKKMKNDIYKLNKFQWNKIKDLIDEETEKYTIKNDGIYLRLKLLSNNLQFKIKKYIDNCLLELENIDDNSIKLENNNIKLEDLIEDSNISFIQNDNNELGLNLDISNNLEMNEFGTDILETNGLGNDVLETNGLVSYEDIDEDAVEDEDEDENEDADED